MSDHTHTVPAFEDYCRQVAAWAKWDYSKKIIYPALGLAGEAGEVVDRIKKLYRGDVRRAIGDDEILLELGDVLYYLVSVARDCGYTMDEVMRANIDKLTARHADGYFEAAK
jgi:NTP pyrophosphatase (non-canonical NTP hydrolase)